MTVHYHGTPITPRTELLRLTGRHFCVSFAHPGDVRWVHENGQGVMLDNGAFTAWKQGQQPDWEEYLRWCERWLVYPNDWCVIPDSIDGGVDENHRLLIKWPFELYRRSAPVWHLDEPIERLIKLATGGFDRVCFGSAGRYAQVGSTQWHERAIAAFNALLDRDLVPHLNGRTKPQHVKIHMLRGMALSGSEYPFASVDSSDIARNHHLTRDAPERAERWDSLQCPATWEMRAEQMVMFADAREEPT